MTEPLFPVKGSRVDPEKDRSKSIGASEIAAVMGLDPQRTPFDIFSLKTGLVDEPDFSKNERVRWGKKLEKVIVADYAEQTGREVMHLGDVLFRSIDRPWESASPDGLCVNEPRGLEVKNVGLDRARDWGETGTDEAPVKYILQCQWGMRLTGFLYWDLVPLIGGNDFRIYPLERDEELIGMMGEAAEKFWRDHILAQVPPPPVGKTVAEYIRKRFPKHVLNMREATPEEAQLAVEVAGSRLAIKGLEETLEGDANRLKLMIGEHEGLTAPGVRVTWKANRDSVTVDWEAAFNDAIDRFVSEEDFNPEAERNFIREKFSTTVPGARPLRVTVEGGK